MRWPACSEQVQGRITEYPYIRIVSWVRDVTRERPNNRLRKNRFQVKWVHNFLYSILARPHHIAPRSFCLDTHSCGACREPRLRRVFPQLIIFRSLLREEAGQWTMLSYSLGVRGC
jgi:hypothetical protein